MAEDRERRTEACPERSQTKSKGRTTIKIPTIGYEIINAILSTSADNILWMGKTYPVRYCAMPKYAGDELRRDKAISNF